MNIFSAKDYRKDVEKIKALSIKAFEYEHEFVMVSDNGKEKPVKKSQFYSMQYHAIMQDIDNLSQKITAENEVIYNNLSLRDILLSGDDDLIYLVCDRIAISHIKAAYRDNFKLRNKLIIDNFNGEKDISHNVFVYLHDIGKLYGYHNTLNTEVLYNNNQKKIILVIYSMLRSGAYAQKQYEDFKSTQKILENCGRGYKIHADALLRNTNDFERVKKYVKKLGLTARQEEILKLLYLYDNNIHVVAKLTNVSRQAIRDNIKYIQIKAARVNLKVILEK